MRLFQQQQDDMLPQGSSGGDTSLGELAELASLTGPVSPQAQQQALDILERYKKGDFTKGEESLLNEYQGVTSRAAQALKDARDRLANTQYDPAQGQLLAAQALMQGNRSGSSWEGMGNAFGALAGARARAQEFELGKQKQLADYDVAIPGMDEKLLNAKLQLQEMHERMDTQLAERALMMLRASGAAGLKPSLQKIKTKDGQEQFVYVTPQGYQPVGKPFGPDNSPDPVQAQAIRDYKQAPPTATAIARSPKLAATWDLAQTLQGPDAAYGGQPRFAAYQQAMKNWEGSGQNAQTIQRFNTALGHLHDSVNWAGDLANGDMTPINKVKNWWRTNMQGKPEPSVFNATKQMVSTEVIASLVQRGGTGEERMHLEQALDSAKNYETLRDVAMAERELMAQRLDKMRFQFKNEVFGTDEDFDRQFVPPETKQAMDEAAQARAKREGRQLSDDEILRKWLTGPPKTEPRKQGALATSPPTGATAPATPGSYAAETQTTPYTPAQQADMMRRQEALSGPP